MGVKITIQTGELAWSRIKVSMMKRDILVHMRQEGAGNCEWIEEWDGIKAAPPAPPTYLHLKCPDCEISWFNDVFTPCPGCQMKSKVTKATVKKIQLPVGVKAMQILPDGDETDEMIETARKSAEPVPA